MAPWRRFWATRNSRTWPAMRLEPIPDPSVDDALRDALGKLKGRPLVGVIGSIGVRRDSKALDALGKLLKDSDGAVAHAAARAIGSLGTPAAAKAL